jgi:hypothetical protein
VTAADIAAALADARREGGVWRCRCPLHGGRSLTLRDGNGGRVLVTCWGGCDRLEVLAELRRRGLLDGYPRPLPLLRGTQNTLVPRTLPLSQDARRLWIAFYDHIEKRVGAGGELEPIRGLANKLPEHAARIAAVLAMISDIDSGEVTDAEMTAGIELAQHYATEALRLFGASRVSSQIRDAQRLLEWLLGTWHGAAVSLPDIYQRGPNFLREAAAARRCVDVLVEHRYLIPEEQGVVGGKSRREVWRIVRG